MKLIVCLALLFHAVSADLLYYTVIYGTNVTSAVQNHLANDQSSLLSVLDSSTPSSMSVCSSGGTMSYSTTTTTTSNNSVRKLSPTERELQINCPSKCSNSGSTYCRSIGCAYCGTCRRNLRSLISASTSVASSIKSSMNSDLSAYCNGVPGCQLWTKVYVVNADGSLTEAI